MCTNCPLLGEAESGLDPVEIERAELDEAARCESAAADALEVVIPEEAIEPEEDDNFFEYDRSEADEAAMCEAAAAEARLRND